MPLPSVLERIAVQQSDTGQLLAGTRSFLLEPVLVEPGVTFRSGFAPPENHYASIVYHIDVLDVLPAMFLIDISTSGNPIFVGQMDIATASQGIDMIAWITQSLPMEFRITNLDTKRRHYWSHVVRFVTLQTEFDFRWARQMVTHSFYARGGAPRGIRVV